MSDEQLETAIPREITTVPMTSDYGCSFTTRPDGENGGSCDYHHIRFKTMEEFDEHRREHHPIACSSSRCQNIAAYTTVDGPHSYCAEHAAEHLDASYKTMRVERPANSEAERLANGHPIEEVLNGLEA